MTALQLQQALQSAKKLPPSDARRVVSALLAKEEPPPAPTPPSATDWMAEAEGLFEAAMGQAVIEALTETFSMMPEDS